MGTIHFIPAEDQLPITTEPGDAMPDMDRVVEFLGARPEFVNVLYEGQWPTTMLVHETGRILRLRVNQRATDIYWEASRQRGVDLADADQRRKDHEAYVRDMAGRIGCSESDIKVTTLDPTPDDPPWIHGNAIVLQGIE